MFSFPRSVSLRFVLHACVCLGNKDDEKIPVKIFLPQYDGDCDAESHQVRVGTNVRELNTHSQATRVSLSKLKSLADEHFELI